MNVYSIASIILTLAVVIAFLNHRFIRIPTTIAIMIGALIISLIAIIVEHTSKTPIASNFIQLLKEADFHSLLLNGMLCFLLFAGAMHIDLSTLKSEKWEIGTLSVFSTLASTLIVGFAIYYFIPILGLKIQVPLLYCLLFGALISPTDPIAVLAIVKEVNAPRRLETIISGESLFNDGIAIVIFVSIYQLTVNHLPVTATNVLTLFAEQAIGGIVYGIVLGYFATYILKQCREINLIILITIAVVLGGYHLALAIHVSGPLAIVITGIIVGNKIHQFYPEIYCKQITLFWDIIDELLNAALFLLIGFEMVTIHAHALQIVAALCAIPIVLIVRFITVAMPIAALKPFRPVLAHGVRMLTWGGLRGGLAVALALSLPHDQYRQFILVMTYACVTFAIIIQGLTMKKLAKKAKHAQNALDLKSI